MIGIMEAGGSKTDFRFGNELNQTLLSGKGINPYIQDDEEIENRLIAMISSHAIPKTEIKNLYYYGAGCSHFAQADRVYEILKTIFPASRISVESDLLGAARALCQDNVGFVGILGTGSNACIYDGNSIQRSMVSLGFWLGDEGSGGYLGKLLFKDWLKNKIPEHYGIEMAQLFGTPKESALEKLYKDPNPNKNVAALAAMAIRHKNDPYFSNLIQNSLNAYFKETEDLYANHKNLIFHFTGSVAWHLSDELTEMVLRMGYRIGNILDNPSKALFEFHINPKDLI
jgi:glucosamine kinase